jgi:hypothetical protein
LETLQVKNYLENSRFVIWNLVLVIFSTKITPRRHFVYPQTELGHDGQQMLKNIPGDVFIFHPPDVVAKGIDFEGKSLWRGVELAAHQGQTLVDVGVLL